jgi:hypothetical protein
VTVGERRSAGRGVVRILGRRGERRRRVLPSARVRGEGGLWSIVCWGALLKGAEDVNQSSEMGSGLTWARVRFWGAMEEVVPVS